MPQCDMHTCQHHIAHVISLFPNSRVVLVKLRDVLLKGGWWGALLRGAQCASDLQDFRVLSHGHAHLALRHAMWTGEVDLKGIYATLLTPLYELFPRSSVELLHDGCNQDPDAHIMMSSFMTMFQVQSRPCCTYGRYLLSGHQVERPCLRRNQDPVAYAMNILFHDINQKSYLRCNQGHDVSVSVQEKNHDGCNQAPLHTW